MSITEMHATLDPPAAPAPVEVAPRAFEYLLNAMELAAHEENPADHGYKAKRAAVFAYVAKLAAEKAEAERLLKLADAYFVAPVGLLTDRANAYLSARAPKDA